MAAEAAGGVEDPDKPQVSSSSATEIPDLTINLDTSSLNESSVSRSLEEIFKFGFSLKDLYKISLEFYKKEKDGLTLTYSNKTNLVALWKQVSCGRYDESKMPETGYFDVIGNDRRKAWIALKDLAPDVAMKQFCETLETNAPSYKAFVEQRKAEIEAEIERKRKEEEERKQKEEERIIKEEQERIRKEEQDRIRLALEAERLKIQEEEKQKEIAGSATEQVNASDPKLLAPQVNGVAAGKSIAPASLWTRPKLSEFISHVKRDASSVLVVGRGETVTIRVPTHEHGSCLFWEFATESYDVGFGVYFEWSASANKSLEGGEHSVPKSDVDSTNNTKGEIESKPMEQIVIHENENNVEVYDKPDEVLPVLRRNSHEEVIVGSHMYPGQGIYLLKFDNSYSLLRSKSLYYRVYYTK